MDQAAAFWYGDYGDDGGGDGDGGDGGGSGEEGGPSLYAWAERTRAKFSFGSNPSPFDVNIEMERELSTLQTMLGDCLAPNQSSQASETMLRQELAKRMRSLVTELVGAMTVPLVQNLVHHMGMVATEGVSDARVDDYMIVSSERRVARFRRRKERRSIDAPIT